MVKSRFTRYSTVLAAGNAEISSEQWSAAGGMLPRVKELPVATGMKPHNSF